jgi:hypothetical protein
MEYLRVKNKYDNKCIIGSGTGIRIKNGIYIAGELYTVREVSKHNLNANFMESVTINPKKTFVMFGARFEMA